MKLQVPLALTFVVGLFMAVQFFVPHEIGQGGYEMLLKWARLVAAFALVLGIASLLRTHGEKIHRRRKDWPYSIVALVSFAVMTVLGIGYGHLEGTHFDWVFRHIQTSLDATMFALLAFFVASAAFRTFRARSVEATLLLATALVVMLGRVPIGQMIYRLMPDVSEWIMSVPTIAGKRGILFGVALGVVATALRIILGIERSHLGGAGGSGEGG